jgi:hypothetical protein
LVEQMWDEPGMRLEIAKTWDGEATDEAERASVSVARDSTSLVVMVEAPYHGDPRPTVAPGRTDRLWDYEVVEVFLLGDAEHYLEIEMGPHGHYLVLLLAGRRQVERQALLMEYEARINGPRWNGRARLPISYLPAGAARGNAFAVSGVGPRRRFLAAYPVPGPRPDFHRLECFGPLTLE